MAGTKARGQLLLGCAEALFVNGQTTQRLIGTVSSLGRALGVHVTLFPRWGELGIRVEDNDDVWHEMAPATPAGIDMRKVQAVAALTEDIEPGFDPMAALQAGLAELAQIRPIPLVRYAAMAGAGAAALGVIFGAHDLLSLILIAASAACGTIVRRALAGWTHNLLVQPFCAALLAGIIGAAVIRLHLGSAEQLVAVCPCMILVPGPHILNGMMDIGRGRIPLGAARLSFAGLVIAVIAAGLLTGLAAGGASLPTSAPPSAVPLALDAVAAGVAVAAYGTFFSMPWRMLPVPVMIGMAAHALRWVVIVSAGMSAEAAAFVACLFVGTIATPVADRLRCPFAAFAFACVVSLIPGVYLFRMASGLMQLAAPGELPHDLLLGTAVNGATAVLIVLAIAAGLVLPKFVIDHFRAENPGAAGRVCPPHK